MRENEFLAESLGLVAEKPEEPKITIFKGSEDTNIMTFENFTEEDEEERKERIDKAVEEFKQGFKGELTEELIEEITKQVTKQMILEQEKAALKLEEERIKLEEEKEQLRQEEFEAQIRELEMAQREEELNKGKLEVVENQVQPNQQGPTHIYIGQQVGEKKKISIGKRLMLKFRGVLDFIIDIILTATVVIIFIFIGYLLSFVVFPNNEVPELLQPLIEYLRPIFKGFIDFILDLIGK